MEYLVKHNVRETRTTVLWGTCLQTRKVTAILLFHGYFMSHRKHGVLL